jgi:hypothetical protein
MSASTRVRLVLIGIAAALVTAGCVSIPDSSRVREGNALDVQDEPDVISNIPVGPLPGATPVEIVSGYFAAMMAYPQNDSIARQFLTPTAAQNWSPDAAVVVYDDQTIVERPDGVWVRIGTLGRLDQRGSWTSSNPASPDLRTELRLTKIDDEWRIVNPLPGVYVNRDHFLRSYMPLSLYFFDPTETVLTPDPTYLLIEAGTATELVRNLLRGPTRDLVGIAVTYAPASTELTGPVVVSEAGRATVPLSADILTLSDQEQQLFAAQLTWTFRQLSDIEQISLQVAGATVDIPGVGTSFSVGEFSGYDPAAFAANRQLFALSRRGMVFLDDAGPVQLSGPIAGVSRRARSAAVDPTGAVGAVVSADGRAVTVAGVDSDSTDLPQVWLRGGVHLLRPSWDVHQLLWVVDRRRGGAVLHAIWRGRDRIVKAPGLSGQRIAGFAVSRDGVRFAAVIETAEAARLVIAKIQRTAERPSDVRLVRVREVVSPDLTLAGVSGLAWDSPTGVVLLANSESGDRQVYRVGIDGSVVEGVTGFLPSRPLSLAAGSNEDAPVAVGTQDGHVYVRTPDEQWAEIPSLIRLHDPTYPG